MILQQIINGFVLGSIYTSIALGLTMIYGILGIINWAHGEIYMIGAFIGLFLVMILKLPFFVSLFASMVIMGIFGVMIDRLVFHPLRYKPENSIIIGTLGISIFLQNLAILVWGPDPQKFSSVYNNIYLEIMGVSITMSRLIVVVTTIILIVVLSVFIRKTKTGKAMRACAQDLHAASLMGIDINYISRVTTAIGAALAAAAGTLTGPIFLVYPTMGIMTVSKAFAVVILGGLGNVEGAIFGGFLLGITESLTSGFLSSYYKDVVAFIILISVLIAKPEGIFSKYTTEKV